MEQQTTSHKQADNHIQHFDMVNVGNKESTQRTAYAQGVIYVGQKAFELIKLKKLPKGDPLALAEVSAILMAKKTAEIIPLCHPLPLNQVKTSFVLNDHDFSISVYGQVSTQAQTGVEMEALAAVQGALLTIYDLAKQVTHELSMGEIRLNRKVGGKSGDWHHPNFHQPHIEQKQTSHWDGIRMCLLTVSDRAFNGVYEDKSGKRMYQLLEQNNSIILEQRLCPDEKNQIKQTIQKWLALASSPDIIITTGGTGLSSRDITPDTIVDLGAQEIPGLGEMLRYFGHFHTPYSWLTRGGCYKLENKLIICLPGSTKGVEQGIDVLGPIIRHTLKTIQS